MGTITAEIIVNKAGLVLNDSGNTRWTEEELIGWINTAQLEIAALKPNTSVSTVNLSLVAGAKQTIEVTHNALIDVIRNLGAAGAVPGIAIRPTDRGLLDVAFPDWYSTDYADAEVQVFWFDEKDQKVFYTYPVQPVDTTQQIEARVTVNPTALDEIGDTISIDNTWEGAILDYILYRAFAKDTSSAPNRERSGFFHQSFMRTMGIRTGLDQPYAADSPKLEDPRRA